MITTSQWVTANKFVIMDVRIQWRMLYYALSVEWSHIAL
jgi:hypothetical protein